MSNHTPGPWQFYADLPSADPHWHIVTNASRMRVLANVHIEPGNETDLANAALITAAPDLVLELEDAADMFCEIAKECGHCNYGHGATAESSDGGTCEECAPIREAERRARAAIAKATGEQP